MQICSIYVHVNPPVTHSPVSSDVDGDRLFLAIKWSEASIISYTLSPCATKSTWSNMENPSLKLNYGVETFYGLRKLLCHSPWSVQGAQRRCLTSKGASLPPSEASETREIPASSPTVHGKTEKLCSPPDQQPLPRPLLEVNGKNGRSNRVVILYKHNTKRKIWRWKVDLQSRK